MNYPVVIVGAGPTGTLCSIHLSLKGIEHLLLEASSFPRDKACADILTSKAIREIQAVGQGVWGKVTELPSFRPIWGTKLSIEDQDFLDIPYRSLTPGGIEPSCVSVKRMELDALLWNQAIELKECKAFENHRVTSYSRDGQSFSIRSQGEEVKSRCLILAHGCQGSLGPASKEDRSSERHTAIGIRAYYRDIKINDADQCELYLKRETMPGGLYIAPLGDGSFNVNMVIRKDAYMRKKINLTDLIKDFSTSNPVLRERFQSAQLCSKVIGHPLSLGTMDRIRYKNGVFLAGDAGGLIDLISANGIPQALLSGRLAADAIESILLSQMSEDEAGSNYTNELHAKISSDLKLGRSLSPLMSYDWFNVVLLSSLRRIHNSDTSNFLQDVLYSEDPWKLIRKKANPFARNNV